MPDTGRMLVTGLAILTPDGRKAGDVTAAAVRDAAAPRPGPRLHCADDGWFDVRERLGRHGYKYLPPACQYLLAAGRDAIEDAGGAHAGVEAEGRAVAVGVNSVASAVHAGMDETILKDGSDALSPIGAPFFSINLFASRLSIEHGLKGFNLTSMGPRVAALEALQAGLRSARLGRASWLLAGAAEAPLATGQPAAEDSECGAAALVLETARAAQARGARSYGQVDARTALLAPAVAAGPRGAERAAGLLGGALGALGAEPDVAMADAVAVLDDSAVGLAIGAALGDRALRVRAGAGCLEPLVQMLGLLARGERPRAVVTAAAEGNVAVALVTPTTVERMAAVDGSATVESSTAAGSDAEVIGDAGVR